MTVDQAADIILILKAIEGTLGWIAIWTCVGMFT